MTFSDFSITVSQNLFKSKMEERAKFVYLFKTSNTKPDVDSIVFCY